MEVRPLFSVRVWPSPVFTDFPGQRYCPSVLPPAPPSLVPSVPGNGLLTVSVWLRFAAPGRRILTLFSFLESPIFHDPSFKKSPDGARDVPSFTLRFIPCSIRSQSRRSEHFERTTSTTHFTSYLFSLLWLLPAGKSVLAGIHSLMGESALQEC